MVATLARARGLTVTALAQAVGLHRNRLADKIAGRQSFTETDILVLADHLGVDPGRLFEDPLELLGVSPALSGRRPSAGSGSSPRRSGCSYDDGCLAA